MSPLALIPIGLYAIVATVGTEVALENARNHDDEYKKKITLQQTIVPTEAIDNAPPARSNPTALATTAELANPVVKEASGKAFQEQVEENSHQLVQKTGTDTGAQYSGENPGQHFPKMDKDDDAGYSAPLGLKDDSHNEWMK